VHLTATEIRARQAEWEATQLALVREFNRTLGELVSYPARSLAARMLVRPCYNPQRLLTYRRPVKVTVFPYMGEKEDEHIPPPAPRAGTVPARIREWDE
jgi:hypothetical protein